MRRWWAMRRIRQGGGGLSFPSNDEPPGRRQVRPAPRGRLWGVAVAVNSILRDLGNSL